MSDRDQPRHPRVLVRSALLLVACAIGVALSAGRDARAQTDPDLTCPIDRPVVFAGFDWNSARLHTAVARYLIENAYGCRTDDLPGSTIPLLAGLRRGDVDVAMEVWMDRATEIWEEGVADGDLASLGVNLPDATQSWFVPRYLVEGDEERGIEAKAPDLKSVTDLLDHVALFKDPERRSKGRFYNCILGWLCEPLNTKKLGAYGLDERFTNFRPGTGAALAAAIAAHYTKGEPFVAYYWDPSVVTARFDLVPLEEPAYSEEAWDAFVATRRPKAAVAYPTIEVHVGVNTAFLEEAGALADFLSAYRTNKEQIRAALLYMFDNRDLEDEEVARWFLRTHPELWRGWLPEDRVARVAARLEAVEPAP